MKRGFIICLMVYGLCYAAEDNVGSETSDSKSTINFRFFDKNKRGAVKLTNTDNPSFNYLTSNSGSGSSSSSSSSSNSGFKPISTITAQPAFRYVYNQQYYQPNPYLTYIQIPQAAQIAAQYSIQSNPVSHFLQTPTQIQYVAAPTVAQIPDVKYQGISNQYSTSAHQNTASDSVSSAATSSQYVPQTQQNTATSSQNYVSSASSTSSSSPSVTSQTKQAQVPLYSNYQAAQPLYYTQQPFFTYFQQPQAANFIYQQPNINYLLKQQQLASIYGANRLGFYNPTQNSQFAYLVPTVVSQPQQDSSSTTSNLKTSDKTTTNTQQSVSSNSYSFATKA